MNTELSDPNFARPAHYRRYPVVLKSAEGCTITDVNGKEYLDLFAVMGSVNCGHNVPLINDRLIEQVHTLWNSNFFATEVQLEAIARVDSVLPRGIDLAALYSTGSEAIELALRIAREATGRKRILSFRDHFHGKTLGAMHLLQSFPDCYGPVPDVYRTVIDSDGSDDPEKIRQFLDAVPADDVAAVIFEPVVGYSGPRLPHREFLATIREFCDRNGVVMIADEILTGFHRCKGWFFSCEGEVQPDVIVFGKGLGNGFPISAVACADALSGHVNGALPGSTFAGNPLACAAACGVLEFMQQQDLQEKGAVLEKMFCDYFSQPRFEAYGLELDGKGGLLSLGLREPAFGQMQEIYLDILSRGVITSHTQKYLRVMPPLTITPNEFEKGLELIGASLDAFFANAARK